MPTATTIASTSAQRSVAAFIEAPAFLRATKASPNV